ncbi:AAA family ATPase [Microbispora sp. RL4-1S]|uniref:AAA family ATPase n=1 Tax=Microbispora oryzae TaxID=2806554 RepID=A0A940WUL6_9ACTN|nr:helix-turn-helix transcriptional regulator [Microbispora oryzae]MBP2707466.1 AAA family ATPase [Microbispora oryzae]
MRDIVASPVFVGRQEELASLAREAAQVAVGAVRLVLVGGEAGVGKTRLVEEAAQAAAGLHVLWGHCVELGPEGLPLAPLVEALRMLARSASPQQLDDWLGPARGPLSQLLPSLDPSAVPGAGHGMGQGAQLPELVLGLIERVSTSRPLLLVIEDLQWADQSTLELLAFLVRGLRDAPVLFVATYRSDEIDRRHPLRPLLTGWERMREVHRLELRRFRPDEVAAQVAGILGRRADTELLDLVVDRSEGNAFLVEEVVRVVRDGGDPEGLSPSLRDLLLVRVEVRSAVAQRLLRAASVAGRQVPERLLAAVTGMEPPAFFTALRELVENHLLLVDEAGQGYTFRHALARDAVYHDMLPGERAGWHIAFARTLSGDARLAPEGALVPAALAHHWLAALDLPSALPALLAAAEASSAYAPAEELKHLERALEIWPRVPDATTLTGTDVIEVLTSAADAAYNAGSANRAMSLLDQALAELGEGSSASRRALLMERRARALRDLGKEAESLAVLEAAQELLPAEPWTYAHAAVLTSLANTLMRGGNSWRRTQATAEHAVAVASAVGAETEQAEALITLGVTHAYQGDAENGLSTLRAGLRLAEQIGAAETTLRGHANHSDLLELLGRHQDAIEAAKAGLELAARTGTSRTLGAWITGNMAEPMLRAGRWQEAEHAAVEALRGEPEGVFAATLLDFRAQLAALAGRREDAERLAGRAAQLVSASIDWQFRLSLTFTIVECHRLAGDLDTAATTAMEALRATPPVGAARYSWPLVWLGTRIAVDRVILARDRRVPDSDAAAMVALVDGLAAIADSLPTLMSAYRGYAAAAAAERARLAETPAVQEWSVAVDAWRPVGEPYLLAYCLLRLAEALCTANDRQAATTALQDSVRLAAEMGALPLSREAEALARRARLTLVQRDDGEAAGNETAAGGQGHDERGPDENASHAGAQGAGRPAAQPENPDPLAHLGLTEREREVLRLLVDGRSNSQIATTLFISPKTVSVHVSNILAKLGVSRRVEAAALAYRLITAQS